jgi:hypothetical protein
MSLNCGHLRACWLSPDDEYGERRWNDTDNGKPKNSEKNLSQSHCVRRLGGVTVSVLAMDPKVAGSNPAKVMHF